MSSDDASDDSGFDKEAEREKLREKYGNEEKDRENTRRMSELLLQGATMTGKHCDNCGDPIFRYDGQEFCPTCQHEAQQSQSAQQGQQTQNAEQAQQAQNAQQGQQTQDSQQAQRSQTPANQGTEPKAAETSEPDASNAEETESDESVSGEPRVEIDGIRVADQQPSASSESAHRHADHSNLRGPPSQQGGRDEGGRHARGHADRAHGHATDRGAGDTRGDLATARELLVRKLTDLARRAEETDDVARSRELLAATREAAEALDALDRANR